ncbi:MAG TPA: hypothetical protein VGN69_03620 [Solirubrobacteraceae bacterium]|nr:hypothetical protein [Solirubrobacteraceae bacterium]
MTVQPLLPGARRALGLVACLAAGIAAAVTPAASRADPASLYRGPGPRPGPSILYAPPVQAPQLSNSGIWRAPPILISGTSAYRAGEFVYEDWIYDDHGAHGSQRDQNDPQKAPGGQSTSSDLFSTPNGTYTYPTDAAYAGNAADFVELRVRPLADSTAFRVALNSLKDPSRIATTIAIGGTPGVKLPFPYGANVSAPADLFLTIHGTTADVRSAVGTPVGGPLPVAVDMARRQLEVRVPHTTFDPAGRVVRLAAGIGLWDREANRYLLPQDNADATHPGGAGGMGAAAPAFFNVAFRFEHSTEATGQPSANQELRPSPSDVGSVATSAAWWRDKAQALALASGDISGLYVNVDFSKLARGANDDMTDRSQGVPTTGAMDRIVASHFETAQGRDYSSGCASSAGCKGELRGRLQPYAIYIPTKAPPAAGYGMTLLLHSLNANYNQYFATRNQSQFGDRATGSIVVTPEGRGTDGWYYDQAGADTFEVWADVAAHYRLDPAFTVVTGYSMGGYGTYKLAAQFPDLFARGQPTVGPPGLGIWAPPAPPQPGGDQSNTNRQLASLRNIPFLIWNASTDELVPAAGAVTQANTFDSLGLRYEFDLFSPPAEHLTLAFNDQYQPAADFLGAARVNPNPAHVTYVYNPTMDFPADGTAAGHAYWVSDVRLRDSSHPSATAPLGTVDARSEGFGTGDPTPNPTVHSAGALTGGNLPALSYASQARDWGPTPVSPKRNALDVEAKNVSSFTVNASRARLGCGARLNVTSDGPLTVNLVGCGGSSASGRLTALGLIGLPSQRRCVSHRRLTIHVRRPRGARLVGGSVLINGRRRERLGGGALRGTRIDLHGLPRGSFRVRVILRVRQGRRTRTVSRTALYHTCARRRPPHRQRPRGRRPGRAQRSPRSRG